MTAATRITSALAFEAVRDSGALNRMQLAVFGVLTEYGPLTGAEVDARLTVGRGHYHKRLSELHAMDVIEEDGERKCRVTGRLATTWRVSGRMPQQVVRAPQRPSRESMRAALRELRDVLPTPPPHVERLIRWMEGVAR